MKLSVQVESDKAFRETISTAFIEKIHGDFCKFSTQSFPRRQITIFFHGRSIHAPERRG